MKFIFILKIHSILFLNFIILFQNYGITFVPIFLLLIYYLMFRNNVINLFIFPDPFNLDNSSIKSLIGSLLSILFIFSAKFVKFISGLIRISIYI